MAGQNVTLQFGPTADKLGAHFWNGQYALLKWADFHGETELVDCSANFRATKTRIHPRLISVLPFEPKEIIDEVAFDDKYIEGDVNVSTASKPQNLFPHIDMNKKSIHNANIDDGHSHPFCTGLEFKELDDDILDSVRYFAEECDYLKVIQSFGSDDHSGGLGARIMEQVADEYSKKLRIVYSVPSEDNYSWMSKALLLHSHKHSNIHIPFALMKPDELKWDVCNYELFPVLASSIDTCLSTIADVFLPDTTIGSIAFGMKMECDSTLHSVDTVIDLMSISSPSFDSIICKSHRSTCPSYIRVDEYGYIPHHTSIICGVPNDLPDYLEKMAHRWGNDLRKCDAELHADVHAYLVDRADK